LAKEYWQKTAFHTKVLLCTAFFYIQFVAFLFFWQKNIYKKAACKMLMKLTPDGSWKCEKRPETDSLWKQGEGGSCEAISLLLHIEHLIPKY
jgi:hypothetical protein